MQALTHNQEIFIHILQDYLADRESSWANMEDIDSWKAIKTYADHHQVTAIFYKQTKNPIFQQAYASQIYRYMNYKQVIASFQDALKDYPYILVKGAAVAELYPVPALRSMGDVDTLIHIEDRNAVNDALINAGFELQKASELGEWKYCKDGYIFEVHDSLVHRYEGKEKLVEYFSHAWDYVDNGQLDWSFHLIYLIEHLRQHFVGKGVGFRQFMDVAIVSQKCDIDWAFVGEELKKIGLYDFATTVYAFIRAWFGIEVPFETAGLSDEFYVSATQKVFEDGVFGFNNEDNQETRIAFQMHYRGVDQKEAKRLYLLHTLFPSYKFMCRQPYCSYVQKSKLLLPVAYVHRIIYRAINKSVRDNIRKQLSSDKINTRMEMLHQWGL